MLLARRSFAADPPVTTSQFSFRLFFIFCVFNFVGCASVFIFVITKSCDSLKLIEGNPPGGVSYLLGCLFKNPEEEDPNRIIWYKFFEGGPLPPGS